LDEITQDFYGFFDEKFQGIILAISLCLIIQLAGMLWSLFLKIAFDGLPNSAELVQYGLHIVLDLLIFLIFGYFAARVNAQFQVHKDIIRANKKIAESLFKYYSDFVGEKASKPGTYVESEGVKFLKKQYGDNFSVEIEKEIKKENKKILATYDSILEELAHEENENPIKILGFAITQNVVQGFGGILVSIYCLRQTQV